MSLEQKLRESLDAAANALVVPEARKSPAAARSTRWSRRLAFAGSGAIAAIALILVPVLLVGPPEPADTVVAPPGDTTPGSADEPLAETFTAPTTSLPPTTVTSGGDVAILGEVATDSHRYTVSAERTGESEMPTANVTLIASTLGAESRPVDEAGVGDPSMFFWHSVTGQGGLCVLSASATGDGESVGVQVLLSPSLGCSEPYIYEVSGQTLTPKDTVPADVASLFVEAWLSGSVRAIEALATPEAWEQAAELPLPDEATFNSCEGVAADRPGTVDCTWETTGATLVVQVSGIEPMPVVMEVGYSQGG